MRIDSLSVWSDIQSIKKISPLVHNITNYVVMEQTANGLLAVGASPVMAHAIEEVEEMARNASSLVLNIGTLSAPWIAGMMLALKGAASKKIPVVFDPVGCGATSFRSATSKSILSHGAVTSIRGNASEILSLDGSQRITKGVDSLLNASEYVEQAKAVAIEHKCIVWMSGQTDVITDGQTPYLIRNGHRLMGKVTGMGCTATAILGAFLAVNKSFLAATVHAAVLMGIAGEIAAERCEGPGSFRVEFIDALYNISLSEIEGRIRLESL